jgi:anti-repressor protein
MNELQIFSNQEFGQIRTVKINDKIYFIASDIAKALGYVNTSKAVKDHCRWVTKCYIPHPQNPEKTLEVNVIPEGDIYRLISNSELPNAQKFESWIFDEVLPTINRHGAYLTPEKIEEVLLNPDTIIQLATQLKQEREEKFRLEEKIKQDKPKVLFADSVAISDTAILIGELAKLLKQNGIDIGEKRLFEWMRSNGYLINRKGTDYNMPTQRSMELGLFRIKETSITHSDGHVTISKTAKVTGKGQIYFINKFKSMQEVNKENVQ